MAAAAGWEGPELPAQRSDLDAALEKQPADGLTSVYLSPRSYGATPADWFDALGMPAPARVGDEDFIPLLSVVWTGIDGHAATFAPFTASLGVEAVPGSMRSWLRELCVA